MPASAVSIALQLWRLAPCDNGLEKTFFEDRQYFFGLERGFWGSKKCFWSRKKRILGIDKSFLISICFRAHRTNDLTKKLEKVGPFECDELEKHCRVSAKCYPTTKVPALYTMTKEKFNSVFLVLFRSTSPGQKHAEEMTRQWRTVKKIQMTNRFCTAPNSEF